MRVWRTLFIYGFPAHRSSVKNSASAFCGGPRPEFFYTFSKQFTFRRIDLPRPNGYYATESAENLDVASALMLAGKAFPRTKDGRPDFAGHQ